MDDALDLAELNRTDACLAWMAHQPGCDCTGCLYVEHHLDDDDDAPERADWWWRP